MRLHAHGAVMCPVCPDTIAAWIGYMLVLGTLEVRADNVETTVLGWPVWIFMPFAVLSCLLWSAAAIMTVFAPQETSDGT